MARRGKYYGRQYGVSEKERLQAAKEERLSKPAVACMIGGCENTTHEAKFVGSMCSPCWEFLVSGRVASSGKRKFNGEGTQETTTRKARERLKMIRVVAGIGELRGGDGSEEMQ